MAAVAEWSRNHVKLETRPKDAQLAYTLSAKSKSMSQRKD